MLKQYGFSLALLYLLAFLSLGIGGFMYLEEYSFSDAFYMVIITITTVGYGEVHPLSEEGRLFTVFLILLSFASLGIVGKFIAEMVVEGIFSGTKQLKKMQKKIDILNGHYILCGFGQVGRAVAEDLLQEQLDFVIVSSEVNHLDTEPFQNCLYHIGDATQEHVLLDAGIKRAKGLITMINSDPTNLYIVLTSRELNPLLHIVSRAEDQHSIKRIKQAGADQVISTYASVGQRITDVVLMHSGKGKKFVDRRKPQTPQWINVNMGSSMVGRSLEQISKQMEKEIIGLRSGSIDQIQPASSLILQAGDQFLILEEPGSEQARPKPGSEATRKVVLVDDNLAILKLYSRLFYKTGFSPLTASEGEEGLKLIEQEQPEIAVIDYQLPKLSGIEICKKMKLNPSLSQTKIVLFTADQTQETRNSALAAGADAVISKSPDAFALIQKVLELQETAGSKPS